MWVLVGSGLGLGCGLFLRWRLNRLDYRLEEIKDADGLAETDRATPGKRWWIPVILAVAWAGLGWGVVTEMGTGQWVRLVGWLAFSVIGMWLSVIDLDVQRLPNSAQLILAVITISCGIISYWDQPDRMLLGLIVGLGCGLGFWLIHLISRGGLGLGDVKLIMTCGWWLGLASLTAVYAAIGTGCVFGLAYSWLTKTRQFAFGPWLIAGTLIAGLVVT